MSYGSAQLTCPFIYQVRWTQALPVVFRRLRLVEDINQNPLTQKRHRGRHSSSVQLSSIAQSYLTLCNTMDYSMPGLPVHHHLLEFTQTHVHWVGDAIQPSHHLLSPSPPTFRLSQHQSFSNESTLRIRWPKYWSFSFGISPSNEYSGLISFRMDWLDLLAVQGTLRSLFQHHSSKASILPCSAFFIVQLYLGGIKSFVILK